MTLDPDVERLIRSLMRERGVSFQKALNDAVRTGLLLEKHRPNRPFVQKTFSLGASDGFRWDKALEIADAMQDEEFSGKLLDK